MFSSPIRTSIIKYYASGGSIETSYGVNDGYQHITYNTNDQVWISNGKVIEIITASGDQYKLWKNNSWLFIENINSSLSKAFTKMGLKQYKDYDALLVSRTEPIVIKPPIVSSEIKPPRPVEGEALDMWKQASKKMASLPSPKKNIVLTKTISTLQYVGSALLVIVLVIGLIALWALSMGHGLNNDDEGYQKFLQQERDKRSHSSGLEAFKKLNEKYGN